MDTFYTLISNIQNYQPSHGSSTARGADCDTFIESV